ncbi:hypothetical protein [Clostridium sp. AM58-1XD]|uniref:hypothetical protein n=1 Tax=Clostridium sp. AM58-1XD TaxID=2292307 RepID=UPI000E4BB81A|nr:hypothetical protein [Clostridium sp. AM58-1XD]RGY95374.1 hypothetical protein DXA13_19330 [Clostridium sp. AM58-1XD]
MSNINKGLDSNGVLYIWNKIKSSFVIKETGKGLSSNDYTAGEKTKLSGIAAGAEVNVQADWNITDTASDAFIKNKPSSLPADGGNSTTVNGHTVQTDVPSEAKFTDTIYGDATQSAHGLMSTADKKKLDGFSAATEYVKKTEITNVYRYKGSVTDASKLPDSGQISGDVYDIQTESVYGPAGQNVAWNGTAWDPLGGIVTIEPISNEELEAILV